MLQDRLTQTREILKYMKSHKRGITSMDAIELFGATRLASIIFSLRKQGYDIATIEEKGKNRLGRPMSSYARYVLKTK